MNTQLNKKPELRRYPPGDRWVPVGMDEPIDEKLIFNTLTDGLQWLFDQYNTKKFIVDAEDQLVYRIVEEEKVKKPTDNKYSIYDE